MMKEGNNNEGETQTMEERNGNTQPKTNRLMVWFISATCSTIALVAIIQGMPGDLTDQGRHVKWAVGAICVTLSLTGLAYLANLFVDTKFVGTPIEGGLAMITLGMWAAVLPTLMDTSKGLAVNRYGGIGDANLYFFSWGGMISSYYLFMGYLFEGTKYYDQAEQDAQKMSGYWLGLAMASAVTALAAGRLNQDSMYDCSGRGSDSGSPNHDRCDRIQFAFSLGAISTAVAVVWMLLRRCVKMILADTAMSILMIVAWTCGIGYITFGNAKQSPVSAMGVGNLYFFTWASFGFACALASHGVQRMVKSFFMKPATPTNPDTEDKDKTGADVENTAGVVTKEEFEESAMEPVVE